MCTQNETVETQTLGTNIIVYEVLTMVPLLLIVYFI